MRALVAALPTLPGLREQAVVRRLRVQVGPCSSRFAKIAAGSLSAYRTERNTAITYLFSASLIATVGRRRRRSRHAAMSLGGASDTDFPGRRR